MLAGQKNKIETVGIRAAFWTTKDQGKANKNIATYIDHREARSKSSLKRYHLYSAARQTGTISKYMIPSCFLSLILSDNIIIE